MRTVILNVGLVTSEKYGDSKQFKADKFLECIQYGLNAWKGTILAHKVERSTTEDTLVLTVELDGMAICESGGILNNLIYNMAINLKQDCIAYYVVEEQKGYLVGEYAEDWGGEFKPEYFLI